MCWPPIRYHVFVDFLIRNICYQACFQISTNFLKIRSTHLEKVLRICCCTSPEKTQLKKGYERYGEMAQKVTKGDNDTCRHMHLILRWPTIRTIHSSFIFTSKYWSRVFCRNGSLFLKYMPTRVIVSFDDFLSHLTIPPIFLFQSFYPVLRDLLLGHFSIWKRHNRDLIFLAGPNKAPTVP